MSKEEVIDKVFSFLKIEESYYDALGKHHVLSYEQKEEFISAFNMKCSEEELNKIINSQWLSVVEPIYVIRQHKDENRIFFYGKDNINYDNISLKINEEAHSLSWPGKSEEFHKIDTTKYHKHYFNIPKLDYGYYDLELIIEEKSYKSLLVIAPNTAFLPHSLSEEKNDGIACHLYSIYSKGSQGIGDFSDLKNLCYKAKEANKEMVLIQPTHYTSILENDHISPYYPISRLFLNPLYIDLRALGFEITENLNIESHVDYNKVIEYKIPLLKKYFELHKSDSEFLKFCKNNVLLENFACYCVLYEKFNKAPWSSWDKELQDPKSKEIRHFKEENMENIKFHKFLQYLSFEQSKEIYKETADMKIGLCNDLAVGSCHHSFEAWYYHGLFMQKASIGAPPDPLEERGQDWGCAPYNPLELRKSAYLFYIELLRRNMKNAGALRLDHAMHINHIFCHVNKENRTSSYVKMNMDELLGIIALESHLNECIIIAEDLGTVSTGFRERLREEKILTTKQIYFEIGPDGYFTNPVEYNPISMTAINSHDTATIKGYENFTDLEYQLGFDIIDTEMFETLCRRREELIAEIKKRYFCDDLKEVFKTMLTESSSLISIMYLDDLTNEKEQLNLPGTTTEHANWGRRLSLPLEEIDLK